MLFFCIASAVCYRKWLNSKAPKLEIEVEDFADILKRLEGYPIALSERTTFYGMREIGVHEPGGHIVVFAARA